MLLGRTTSPALGGMNRGAGTDSRVSAKSGHLGHYKRYVRYLKVHGPLGCILTEEPYILLRKRRQPSLHEPLLTH